MQKRFASNLILLVLLNLIIKPFYILGIDAEIQNQVGENIYGNYFALINFSFLLNILLDLGICNYNTTHISKHANDLKKYFSGIFSLRLLLMVLYLLVLWITGWFIDYTPAQINILLWLGLNQGLAALILYFRSNLSGLHLFKTDSIISILDRSILILLMSVLLWGNVTGGLPFDIRWFIYGQTIAYALTAITAFLLVRKKAKGFHFSIDIAFWRQVLYKSSPYALLVLIMTLNYRLDSVMLERMLPDGALQAGIYAKGYRLFEASNMIAYLFASLLLPLFARAIKEQEDVFPLLRLSFKILFSGAFILAMTCLLFDIEILGLRFHSELNLAAPVFSVLMFSFLAVCMSYIFGTLLTAKGSMKWLNIIALVCTLLNLLLNAWLIPTHMAYGSALASLISQALMAVAQIVAVFIIFKPDWQKSFLISLIAFLTGVLILAWSISTLDYHWQLRLLIFVIGSLLIGLLSGMLSIKKFIVIMRS